MATISTTANTPAQATGWRRFLQNNWLFLVILILLIVLPQLIGALTNSNPLARRGESVFQQAQISELMIYGILAMSYNLIFGFTGVISFGHALFFGLSAYIFGGFLRGADPVGVEVIFAAVAAALVVCAVLGLVVGLVTLRLKGVYFAIFTLAVAEMGYIFLRSYAQTGSEDGFTVTALPSLIDPNQNRLTFYYLVLIVFVLTFIFIRRLIASPTGAVLLAIRENENRAKTIGYNTLRFKLLAITLGGVLAGVAGILFAMLNKKVGPEMLSSLFTVDPLLMTIIGGVGTLSGPVVGAFGLRLLQLQLRNAKITIGGAVIEIGQSWTLVLGSIFILAVIVFPRGIVGTINMWRARRK